MITTPIIIYALAFFVKALIPLGFIVATIQYHTTQNLFRTYHFSSFSYPQTRITCYNPDMIMRTLQRYTSLAFAVLLLISLGVSNRIQTPATVEAAVPAGFTIKDIPSGQSEALTSFDSAPDQSFFTTGKNGRVAWVSPSGATTTLATLPVVTNQDLGLTSIAVAKDFVTSKKVYTVRTLSVSGQWTMRLSSWIVNGAPTPTGLTNEQVILELPASSDVHAMTGILAAADGSLWVSIGDGSDFRFVDPAALRALDINQGYGKILHILPSGAGVTTNPYYDSSQPSSWKSRVYASGFRSPFRLSLDPASGAPIVGDVGYNNWEEIDIVRPGASYGWPCWEGENQTPGYRDLSQCAGIGNAKPLTSYAHGVMGTSVTGGIAYTGTTYPAAYRGAYFFGDYAAGRIYTLRYDSAGNLTQAPETDGFITGNGGPVQFGTAANGDIIYADIWNNALKQISYTPGNRAPTAL